MQVGVISDIHGNLVALEAVLADMPPVELLVCAGDVVGYNPWHAECVAAMRGDPTDRSGGAAGLSGAAADRLPDGDVPTVMGNHDRAVAEGGGFGFNGMASAGVRHAREALSAGQIDWLRDLPAERTVLDGRLKLVHGHPDDPDRYTYPEEYSPRMLGEEDVLVTGHTHVQGHEIFEAGTVMNPGSVGQPRDGDSRSAYALVDLDDLTVEERRVEYDVDRVIAAVDKADLPERIGTRLLSGR